MTGILLRKDLKTNFNSNPPQIGEIVYSEDTNEIGMLVDGELYWQDWVSTLTSANYLFSGESLPDNSLGVDADKYIQTKDNGGNIELIEFVKENGSWRELQKGETDQSWVDDNLELNYHNIDDYPFLGKYGYRMQQGYNPSNDLDVATLGYIDTLPSGFSNFIKLDGSRDMDSGYVPTDGLDVITVNFLLSGDAQILPPTVEPCVVGALWNNNGVLEISGPCIGHIRYYTTASSLDFSILGTLQTTNGYVDVVSNDNPILQSSQETITKIEVLKYGNRTSWNQLAYDCSNMTEFVVTATDTSKVTNFRVAWHNCSSLTSFPQLDVSSGISFSYAWGGCSSLTSFPQLDVSSGTNFDSAWFQCSSLTSFPQLDVSSGTDFSYAWGYCSSLTSFPQLDVSSGTNFGGTWNNCSSLTSFPQLDVSSGTDFSYAWQYCSSLTSFPQLDVSSGTDFSDAWYNCTSLPHCPAGNEVTIPQGATTTNMCVGI